MRQTEVLLELLKAAVLNQQPSIPKEVVIDWDALMDNASSHNVLAWVWDSVCKLPVEQQPPRQQRINWGLSAQEVWDAYYYRKEVLGEMVARCIENNVKLLLLKGMGVSEIYPRPQSRPSGDIDIFLFDDFDKGKELFGEHEEHGTVLHDKYYFKGILIENHKMFIYPNTPVKILVGQHLLNALDKIVLTSSGYYTFAPLDNFVYLMMHALNHINFTSNKGLYSLKSITDLVVFFHTYRPVFTPNEVLELMKKLHLEKSFEVIIYFTEWLLKEDCSAYRIGLIRSKDLEIIRTLFVQEGLAIEVSESDSFWKQSWQVWQRYHKYKAIYKYLPKHKKSILWETMKLQLHIIKQKVMHS